MEGRLDGLYSKSLGASAAEGTLEEGRPGKRLKVWNRATFFSLMWPIHRSVGCFSLYAELPWLAPKC